MTTTNLISCLTANMFIGLTWITLLKWNRDLVLQAKRAHNTDATSNLLIARQYIVAAILLTAAALSGVGVLFYWLELLARWNG